jgi:preprotein translocase subunit Sec61beta
VVACFLIPGAWGNGNTWFFAIVGFVATSIGCFGAAVLLRRRIALTPHAIVAVAGICVAVVLLAVFSTMWSWPFAGVGFIVSWVVMAAGFTVAFMFGASYRYA